MRVESDIKTEAKDILQKSEDVFSAASDLYTGIETDRPYKVKENIIAVLKKAETLYLKSRELSIYLREKNDDQSFPAATSLGSLKVFSERAYLFTLPPMRSVRKKKETLGLGDVLKSEVISLVKKAKDEGFTINQLDHPVVHFVHCVSRESIEKGMVTDADNLDSAKVVDGLQSSLIIKNDTVLSITLVHEGFIGEEDKTLLYVYEKGYLEDFKN